MSPMPGARSSPMSFARVSRGTIASTASALTTWSTILFSCSSGWGWAEGVSLASSARVLTLCFSWTNKFLSSGFCMIFARVSLIIATSRLCSSSAMSAPAAARCTLLSRRSRRIFSALTPFGSPLPTGFRMSSFTASLSVAILHTASAALRVTSCTSARFPWGRFMFKFSASRTSGCGRSSILTSASCAPALAIFARLAFLSSSVPPDPSSTQIDEQTSLSSSTSDLGLHCSQTSCTVPGLKCPIF
mmetsp:Transcript_12741/g.54707  ORF Transcript_12741/g.54707 Transcript_12741/m.54707 type:complete len:246 (+) Transcript_12741:2004-2741(+)